MPTNAGIPELQVILCGHICLPFDLMSTKPLKCGSGILYYGQHSVTGRSIHMQKNYVASGMFSEYTFVCDLIAITVSFTVKF
jgi:hypothetical protein